MSYTCPHCNSTSHNPNDEREAYCGMCHHFCRDVDTVGELYERLHDGKPVYLPEYDWVVTKWDME